MAKARICKNCKHAEELDRGIFICDYFTSKPISSVYDTEQISKGNPIKVTKKYGMEILIHVSPKSPPSPEINIQGLKYVYEEPEHSHQHGDYHSASPTFYVDGDFGCNKFK